MQRADKSFFEVSIATRSASFSDVISSVASRTAALFSGTSPVGSPRWTQFTAPPSRASIESLPAQDLPRVPDAARVLTTFSALAQDDDAAVTSSASSRPETPKSMPVRAPELSWSMIDSMDGIWAMCYAQPPCCFLYTPARWLKEFGYVINDTELRGGLIPLLMDSSDSTVHTREPSGLLYAAVCSARREEGFHLTARVRRKLTTDAEEAIIYSMHAFPLRVLDSDKDKEGDDDV